MLFAFNEGSDYDDLINVNSTGGSYNGVDLTGKGVTLTDNYAPINAFSELVVDNNIS